MHSSLPGRAAIIATAVSLLAVSCGSDDTTSSDDTASTSETADTGVTADTGGAAVTAAEDDAVTTDASDGTETTDGAVEDLGTIRVGLVCGGMTPAIAQIAINTDSFAPAGVDVEKLCFDGGSEGVQSLIGGSIDVFLGSFEHIASTRGQGLDTRGYAVINNAFPYWALTATDSSFESVSDLAGETVGVTSPGSLSETGLRAATQEAGVAFDDLTVIGAGSGATMRAALDAGQVAAGMVSEPGISELTQAGDYRVLWEPEFPYVSIVAIASEGWVADHSSEMSAFIGVLQDTAVRAGDDLDWAVEAMSQEGFEVDPDALTSAVESTLAGVPEGLTVDADAVDGTSELLISVDRLEEPLSIDEGFDFSYLNS